MSNVIQKSTFQFLLDIKENNHRDWFHANKPYYQAALDNIKAFQKDLHNQMTEHDEIESAKLFRIYRDVRFSKDKTPYKSSFSGSFVRATKWRRGGYYFHIEPQNTFLAGGFWNPNSPDLKRIRYEIAHNTAEFRSHLEAPTFQKAFGKLHGDQVKTAPKGYPKDHPAIDLLRYKQLIVMHHFEDQDIFADDFAATLNGFFKKMRPFLDFMSSVLTTDENGVPIED